MATQAKSLTALASSHLGYLRAPEIHEVENQLLQCHLPVRCDVSLTRWFSLRNIDPKGALEGILFSITMNIYLPPSAIMANCNNLG